MKNIKNTSKRPGYDILRSGRIHTKMNRTRKPDKSLRDRRTHSMQIVRQLLADERLK